MKKLLCSNFAFLFLREAAKSGNDFSGNWVWIYPERKGSYTKTSQKTDAGIMITETFSVDLKESDANNIISCPSEPVLLKIATADGNILMGSDEYPVFFTYTGDTYTIKITFTAQSSV